MFATIVGAVMALFFLGLPLAIGGLFVLSILDRRNRETIERPQEQPATDSFHADRIRADRRGAAFG
jgi:hypothetical protein